MKSEIVEICICFIVINKLTGVIITYKLTGVIITFVLNLSESVGPLDSAPIIKMKTKLLKV
jgi:hypothetical protein